MTRILQDSSSQVSFVSKCLVDRLRMPTLEYETPALISGIEDCTFQCTHSCSSVVRSKINKFELQVEADVVEKISYVANVNWLQRLKKAHKAVCFADYDMDDGTVDVLIESEYLEKYFVFKRPIVDGYLTLRSFYFSYVLFSIPEKFKSASQKLKLVHY